MNTRWSEEEKTEFRRLWATTMTVPEIALAMDKSESAIKNQRVALNLPARRTGELSKKVRVGFRNEEYQLLERKARRNSQTVPGRIRHLVNEDLGKP